MNLFKRFLVNQYFRFIPSEKIIFISGEEAYETIKASQLVLSDKLMVLSSSGKEGIDDLVLKYRPKIDKIIMGVTDKKNGFFPPLVEKFRPKFWVLTSSFLGDEGNLLEKVKSFPEDGSMLLNWNDKNLRALAQKLSGNVFFYGFDSASCHVWAGNARISDFQTIFELNYGVERVEIRSKLLGFHQIEKLLAAAILATTLNFSLTSIKKSLEKIEQFPHELEVLQGHNNSVVIDDTHNATSLSITQAIEVLNQVTARRRILVLGEMRNLGEESEKLHRQIARVIYSNKIDGVFLGVGETKFVADELMKLGFLGDRMEVNLQNPQIVSKLLKNVLKGDVVLITGAYGLKFDEIVKKVSKSS